jgi:hypothetical protein
MRKGAQPTYFREPHIICRRAACGSRAAVWLPLVYVFGWTAGSKFFFLLPCPKTDNGSHQAPVQLASQALSARVKQSGVKLTTHLNLLSRLKLCGPVNLIPTYIFMTLCLIKRRDRFTCNYLHSQYTSDRDFLIAMNLKIINVGDLISCVTTKFHKLPSGACFSHSQWAKPATVTHEGAA